MKKSETNTRLNINDKKEIVVNQTSKVNVQLGQRKSNNVNFYNQYKKKKFKS